MKTFMSALGTVLAIKRAPPKAAFFHSLAHLFLIPTMQVMTLLKLLLLMSILVTLMIYRTALVLLSLALMTLLVCITFATTLVAPLLAPLGLQFYSQTTNGKIVMQLYVAHVTAGLRALAGTAPPPQPEV